MPFGVPGPLRLVDPHGSGGHHSPAWLHGLASSAPAPQKQGALPVSSMQGGTLNAPEQVQPQSVGTMWESREKVLQEAVAHMKQKAAGSPAISVNANHGFQPAAGPISESIAKEKLSPDGAVTESARVLAAKGEVLSPVAKAVAKSSELEGRATPVAKARNEVPVRESHAGIVSPWLFGVPLAHKSDASDGTGGDGSVVEPAEEQGVLQPQAQQLKKRMASVSSDSALPNRKRRATVTAPTALIPVAAHG